MCAVTIIGHSLTITKERPATVTVSVWHTWTWRRCAGHRAKAGTTTRNVLPIIPLSPDKPLSSWLFPTLLLKCNILALESMVALKTLSYMDLYLKWLCKILL